MNLTSLLSRHFEDHIETANQTLHALGTPLEAAIETCFGALTNGSKVLACGNGGSAADAQHFIAELVGRFERERLPLAGITLSADTSIMTAVGNDYGFDQVFARQVAALGQPGDVLVAMSTSGNSANVVQAIQIAHEREMSVIALTGRDGGKIGQMLSETDVHLCVPHNRTMRIQEMHILMLHLICDGIDAMLLGESQ